MFCNSETNIFKKNILKRKYGSVRRVVIRISKSMSDCGIFNSQLYANQFHLFCSSVYIGQNSDSENSLQFIQNIT